MSDEEVIKRRLLMDGEGTGDDRRLNVLLKLMVKWANSKDDSPTENQAMYDRILCLLSQCEFSVKRSQLLMKTNAKQHEKYKELQSQIEQQIADTKEDISKGKERLAKAQAWKHNQMMCDMLIKSIKEQPSCKETNERLSNLQSELTKLNEERNALQEKLDIRQKQFHMFISSFNKLEAPLEGSSNENISANSPSCDTINSPAPEAMSD